VRSLWRLLYRHREVLLKYTAIFFAPICAINLAVGFFGQTPIFPFSPFFLKQKVVALWHYSTHRPWCLLMSDAEIPPLISAAEQRHGLPSGLLAALIQVESASMPHRISSAGAMGPGQLIPSTARALSVEDPFDPKQAIDASARYLASHLRRYGSIRLAVAAYNAGPGAVTTRVPQNGETEHYVARVMAEYAKRARPSRSAPKS
jgi:hypothetical protein